MSDSSSSFTLWAQGQQVALPLGFELQRALFPMLVPANPGGPVAVVNANPNDPTQLGLRNLTVSPWTATLPDGTQKEISTDKSIRLVAGTVIQAGPTRWEIREQPALSAAPPPAFAPPPPVVGQPAPFSPPPANPGFLAASEPIRPNPGFLAASEPAAPPPLAQPGYVIGQPPPAGPMGYAPPGQPPPYGPPGFGPPGQPGQPPRRPGGAARNILATSSLSFSQLFPVAGDRQTLKSKGFLVPGVLTAVLVALLFATGGHPAAYNNLIALYIGAGALYIVYRLCGKARPWWTLLVAALFTAIFINTPLWSLVYGLFNIIGGPDNDNRPFPVLLFHYTFAVGLREEIVKAIPVFIFLAMGMKAVSPRRENIGVWEPLDGILLGAASALGFTLAETLGQYVPGIIANVSAQAGEGMGQAMGLELLIPRLLGTFTGHMAYSGTFGYFIGLSMLKPKHRWRILGIGYATAAVLHGVWDASLTATGGLLSLVVMCVLGIASYAFLIAAILKARQLSPSRAQNFATQIKGVS